MAGLSSGVVDISAKDLSVGEICDEIEVLIDGFVLTGKDRVTKEEDNAQGENTISQVKQLNDSLVASRKRVLCLENVAGNLKLEKEAVEEKYKNLKMENQLLTINCAKEKAVLNKEIHDLRHKFINKCLELADAFNQNKAFGKKMKKLARENQKLAEKVKLSSLKKTEKDAIGVEAELNNNNYVTICLDTDGDEAIDDAEVETDKIEVAGQDTYELGSPVQGKLSAQAVLGKACRVDIAKLTNSMLPSVEHSKPVVQFVSDEQAAEIKPFSDKEMKSKKSKPKSRLNPSQQHMVKCSKCPSLFKFHSSMVRHFLKRHGGIRHLMRSIDQVKKLERNPLNVAAVPLQVYKKAKGQTSADNSNLIHKLNITTGVEDRKLFKADIFLKDSLGCPVYDQDGAPVMVSSAL